MKNLGGNEGGAVGLLPSHRSPSPLIRVRISDIVVGRRPISERGANFIEHCGNRGRLPNECDTEADAPLGFFQQFFWCSVKSLRGKADLLISY